MKANRLIIQQIISLAITLILPMAILIILPLRSRAAVFVNTSTSRQDQLVSCKTIDNNPLSTTVTLDKSFQQKILSSFQYKFNQVHQLGDKIMAYVHRNSTIGFSTQKIETTKNGMLLGRLLLLTVFILQAIVRKSRLFLGLSVGIASSGYITITDLVSNIAKDLSIATFFSTDTDLQYVVQLYEVLEEKALMGMLLFYFRDVLLSLVSPILGIGGLVKIVLLHQVSSLLNNAEQALLVATNSLNQVLDNVIHFRFIGVPKTMA